MIDTASRREPSLDAPNIAGISKLKIFMADALAACQKAVRELLRIEVHVSFNLFKPLHPIARGTLQFERFNFALFLVALKSVGNTTHLVGQHAG